MIVTSKKMKVLVTGAGGRIGQAFREIYRNHYSLRLMYHRKPVEPSIGEEIVHADITDFDSVLKATEGVQAVVHLAANPRVNAPWDSILNTNIIGTYNVFESARRCGVKKIVFASSNHACGFAVNEYDLVGPDAPVRPDSLYGVSKAFGEALGRYYFEKFGLSVICLRIGWCPGLEDPTPIFEEILSGRRPLLTYSAKKLIAMWISNRDIAQLIHRSIESDVEFGIFYGASDNTPGIFDLTETKKKLGYEPRDRVEDYIGEL